MCSYKVTRLPSNLGFVVYCPELFVFTKFVRVCTVCVHVWIGCRPRIACTSANYLCRQRTLLALIAPDRPEVETKRVYPIRPLGRGWRPEHIPESSIIRQVCFSACDEGVNSSFVFEVFGDRSSEEMK